MRWKMWSIGSGDRERGPLRNQSAREAQRVRTAHHRRTERTTRTNTIAPRGRARGEQWLDSWNSRRPRDARHAASGPSDDADGITHGCCSFVCVRSDSNPASSLARAAPLTAAAPPPRRPRPNFDWRVPRALLRLRHRRDVRPDRCRGCGQRCQFPTSSVPGIPRGQSAYDAPLHLELVLRPRGDWLTSPLLASLLCALSAEKITEGFPRQTVSRREHSLLALAAVLCADRHSSFSLSPRSRLAACSSSFACSFSLLALQSVAASFLRVGEGGSIVL